MEVHGGRTDSAVLVPLYAGAGGELARGLHPPPRRPAPPRRRDLVPRRAPRRRRDAARATALREAHEEIGLPPDASTSSARSQPSPTFVTNYAIYPFVGVIEPGLEWVPQRTRGRRGARVPARRAARRPRRAAAGAARASRSAPTTYEVGDHMIWGATARIVADLLDRIGPPVTGSDSPSDRPGRSALFDRHVDEVAPLGPRAVVVLDVLLAEQLVQHEPGVRRALADPAVGDDRLAVRDPLAAVQASRSSADLNVPSS